MVDAYKGGGQWLEVPAGACCGMCLWGGEGGRGLRVCVGGGQWLEVPTGACCACCVRGGGVLVCRSATTLPLCKAAPFCGSYILWLQQPVCS